MKKSMYANIIRGSEYFIVHNTLYGGIVKAKCDESKAFLDMIETTQDFNVDENEDFFTDLKNLKMIVDNDIYEENLADYYYNEQQRQYLQIIVIPTRNCNFRCTYCYEEHEDNRMTSGTYDGIVKAIELLLDRHGLKRWSYLFLAENLYWNLKI